MSAHSEAAGPTLDTLPEGQQILDGAAAAGDDDDVDLGITVEPLQLLDDVGGAA